MDGQAQEPKEEINEAFRYTTYLVGAMQVTAEKDGGGAKRAALDAALRARNIYPINPVTLEASKTGVTTEDLTAKMKGWIASGNWEKFAEQSNSIWKGHTYVAEDASLIHVPGDIEYVKMSDWITFLLHEGDSPCGSFAECGIAMEHNIPIYLITDIPKRDLRQSLLQMIMVTGGEVFRSEREYLDFIDKKYGVG